MSAFAHEYGDYQFSAFFVSPMRVDMTGTVAEAAGYSLQRKRGRSWGRIQTMAFDAPFARDVLLSLTNAAYELSWGQAPKLPPGWQQTATVTVDQSTIDRESASGLAKIVISENCDWGLVARKDDVSVIAIRGTETQHQWLEDFTAIAQPVAHESWWIHHGFHDVWSSIAPGLQKAWDTASSANAHVYITGHSLGAALALIMGVHHPEALTWTFAGPAVFSPIHGLPPATNVVRIVNSQDLVPKVPVPPLYEHIGTLVSVDGAGDRFDFALQHGLNTYSDGLSSLIGH
jgi:triacylglycerol lipase